MVCGAAGTRLHAMKTMHVVSQEEVAGGNGDPAKVSRPFDRDRSGMVLGEGAGAIIIEELAHARARGATITARLSPPLRGPPPCLGRLPVAKLAMANVLRALWHDSGLPPDEIDHFHAHGLSTRSCDVEEAQAIMEVFGQRAGTLPVVAAKSAFGNLGAGSGMVELIASLLALRAGVLFPTLELRDAGHRVSDPGRAGQFHAGRPAVHQLERHAARARPAGCWCRRWRRSGQTFRPPAQGRWSGAPAWSVPPGPVPGERMFGHYGGRLAPAPSPPAPCRGNGCLATTAGVARTVPPGPVPGERMFGHYGGGSRAPSPPAPCRGNGCLATTARLARTVPPGPVPGERMFGHYGDGRARTVPPGPVPGERMFGH